MDDKTREKIEQSIKDLPTLPTVAMKIFEVTNDPESCVDDLRDIISTDQVVAGRILKAVNSAYFGFPRQIDTLSKAIVILGFNNVRSLALSVSIMDVYASKKGVSGFNLQELWKHAVGTAFCAKSLGKLCQPREMEKLFIAGLLHDIGLVAMNQCFRENFDAMLRNMKKVKKPIHEIESEMFGFTHGDVGYFIGEKWLLPKGLSMAIGLHHDPGRAAGEDKPLVYAIHLADFLCRRFEFGNFGDNEYWDATGIFQPALEMFRFSEGQPPPELQTYLENDMKDAADFMGII